MQKRKAFILCTTMAVVTNSTMGSSLPSNAIPYFSKEWGVTSDIQKVLPFSMFLLGRSPGHLLAKAYMDGHLR